MAPQHKRQNTTKAPVVAKKAKVEKVDTKLEDPIFAHLVPIVDALASSKLPASCQELLRAALPHCFGGPIEERHAYQLQMLELTTAALEADVADKRAGLETIEQKISQLQAELVASRADVEAATTVATTKKHALEMKSEDVSQARAGVQTAKQEMELEMKRKESFLAEQVVIHAEQQEFQDVLTELWEPLKSSSFTSQQSRKRDKAIFQLHEKLKPLELEECLLDAVTAALKLREDRRGEFAEKAFKFLEEAFHRQQLLLAERVAGSTTREQEHEKSLVERESNFTEMKVRLADQEKEEQILENEWVELETNVKQAKDMEFDSVGSLEAAFIDVANEKTKVQSALSIAEFFAQLKNPQQDTVVEHVEIHPPSEPVALEAIFDSAKELAPSLNQADVAEVVVAA